MVGFKTSNRDKFSSNYICPTCSLLLRDPVQLSECGHRQCQSCIDTQYQKIVICPVCQIPTPIHEVKTDRGCNSDMQSLSINCLFCEWKGVLQHYQEHLDQFHPTPKCQYCNQQFDSHNKLNEHQLSQCRKVTVDCLLKDFGCSEQITHDTKEAHYLTQLHQDAILNATNLIKSQLNDTQMDIDPSQTTTTVTNPTIDHLQDVHEVVNVLSNGLETLNDDNQHLNNESLRVQIQLQTLTENTSQVKQSIDETTTFLSGVKQNQDILSQDALSIKEKIDDLQNVSYDGTFIWKITNVKEKIGDARSERQSSVYSPPFYSSPTGYKMRLRLYLFGDGNARRTHMSLFFVLMRGVNDAILKFPFNYKVSFCLYDQSGEEKHVIDSFRPDIKSNSFQRPRSDMNIASGIPKFILLSMLEEENSRYVRDDTMFIKVMVDMSDTNKTLLPYMFSLNPGLPIHVQQLLIKQEVERRVQHQQLQTSST
ncbi:unnamed protein product [Adineta steineri]|uniref:Uncharacterized protein n=1 Tax=Adineta steineri TaxID=433720 RepID=A0A814NTI7_9BILA|nr:unnamed protein product [Adineta steineri]CAF1098445.1 unnamed protein product [Adineta steineri]CAF1253533.1 unnamed protein product [Adineta steineri]CAF4053488.1 unnamed protein product [Adineta steineri]